MPSDSKAQARFWEEMYHNPKLAKERGIDHDLVKEWVEQDRSAGTKHLPERSGTKTTRSKKRKK